LLVIAGGNAYSSKRPEAKERPTDQELSFDRAPVPRVGTGRTIVAHHKIFVAF